MKSLGHMLMTILLACALSACGGDKKDSADREKEAQKAIQEGMQKGVESMEKKMEGQKEETKK